MFHFDDLLYEKDFMPRLKQLKSKLPSSTHKNSKKEYAKYSVYTSSSKTGNLTKGYIERNKFKVGVSDASDTFESKSIVDSFNFNWLQMAVIFQSVLIEKRLPSELKVFDAFIRLSDGVMFDFLSLEEKKAAMSEDDYTYDYLYYLEKKKPDDYLAYSAMEGFKEMYNALNCTKYNSYEQASVYLMRASLSMKSLITQQMERPYKIGFKKISDGSNGNTKQFLGDLPDIQKRIDTLQAANKKLSASAIRQRLAREFNIGDSTLRKYVKEELLTIKKSAT